MHLLVSRMSRIVAWIGFLAYSYILLGVNFVRGGSRKLRVSSDFPSPSSIIGDSAKNIPIDCFRGVYLQIYSFSVAPAKSRVTCLLTSGSASACMYVSILVDSYNLISSFDTIWLISSSSIIDASSGLLTVTYYYLVSLSLILFSIT